MAKRSKTPARIPSEPLFENLKPSRRKRKNVPVRPTEDELARLHERKSSFGYKSLSKYLIERGLCEGEMIALLDGRKVERLLFEVRKIGVNINQIARRLNEGKRPHSQDALDRAAGQAEQVLREIAEAIIK
jgi:hypothetical protein